MKTMRIGANRETGFTLVEIAIVLVIIGLLLGGILKGQEMITQARIKNMANDFNGVTAAYFSYQDRYKAVPGDDSQAAGRWPAAGGVNAAPAGDNSGTVAGTYFANGAVESRFFWEHLRRAGMIAGPADSPNQPANAVGGIVGVQDSGLQLNGPVICTTNVPDKIAIALDTQLDDSRPSTGTIRALAGGGNVATGGEGQANQNPMGGNYTETGGAQFVICKSL